MATKKLDYRGLKCPDPVLKLTVEAHSMAPGDIVEVLADCPTFEDDVKNWCQRNKKALLLMRKDGNAKNCQLRI